MRLSASLVSAVVVVVAVVAACEAPVLSVPSLKPTTTETAPVAAAPTTTAPPVASAATTWTIDETQIPAGRDGDLIRHGKRIADTTAKLLPDHVGNALRCSHCHLGAGTVPHAAAWVGVTDRYPQYRARTGKDDTIEERINDCFERSMNGTALKDDALEMRALVAWMTFLSKDVDGKAVGERAKIPLAKLTRAPDAVHGRAVYETKCQSCHGPDGAGIVAGDVVAFPPLSGAGSFNIGAGMARLRTAAGFIRANMPLGQGNTLSDDDAFDVAAFVTTMPRPDFAAKAKDWPRGGKPDDARY